MWRMHSFIIFSCMRSYHLYVCLPVCLSISLSVFFRAFYQIIQPLSSIYLYSLKYDQTLFDKYYSVSPLFQPYKAYGKGSKISNTFLVLFSNTYLLSGLEFTKCLSEYQTGKTLIRLLLQKQSDLGLHCLSRPFGRQIVFKILEHLLYAIYATH